MHLDDNHFLPLVSNRIASLVSIRLGRQSLACIKQQVLRQQMMTNEQTSATSVSIQITSQIMAHTNPNMALRLVSASANTCEPMWMPSASSAIDLENKPKMISNTIVIAEKRTTNAVFFSLWDLPVLTVPCLCAISFFHLMRMQSYGTSGFKPLHKTSHLWYILFINILKASGVMPVCRLKKREK